jgi:hypothetical protein
MCGELCEALPGSAARRKELLLGLALMLLATDYPIGPLIPGSGVAIVALDLGDAIVHIAQEGPGNRQKEMRTTAIRKS